MRSSPRCSSSPCSSRVRYAVGLFRGAVQEHACRHAGTQSRRHTDGSYSRMNRNLLPVSVIGAGLLDLGTTSPRLFCILNSKPATTSQAQYGHAGTVVVTIGPSNANTYFSTPVLHFKRQADNNFTGSIWPCRSCGYHNRSIECKHQNCQCPCWVHMPINCTKGELGWPLLLQ